MTWNWRSGLWKVLDSTQQSKQSPVLITGMVRAELEVRGLVYTSRLKTTKDITYPWIENCLRKLESETLDENKLIVVLCFVSCVALMMNGWYVDYSRLEKLLLKMPVNQSKLKDLKIQSKLRMAKFNKFKLFRLHQTIPHRLSTSSGATACQKNASDKQSPNITESERAGEEACPQETGDEMELIETRMEKQQPFCMPSETGGVKRRWKSEELEALHNVSRKTLKTLDEKYKEFKTECIKNNIPFRTKKAFKVKLSRL